MDSAGVAGCLDAIDDDGAGEGLGIIGAPTLSPINTHDLGRSFLNMTQDITEANMLSLNEVSVCVYQEVAWSSEDSVDRI